MHEYKVLIFTVFLNASNTGNFQNKATVIGSTNNRKKNNIGTSK